MYGTADKSKKDQRKRRLNSSKIKAPFDDDSKSKTNRMHSKTDESKK